MAVATDVRTGKEGRATKADLRRSMGRASARDSQRQRAYEAGQRGDEPTWDGHDDELFDAYAKGQEDADTTAEDTAAKSSAASPAPRPTKAFSAADEGAGLILGLLAAAVAINWIKGGNSAARAWVSAKFWGKPPAPPAPPTKSTPGPPPAAVVPGVPTPGHPGQTTAGVPSAGLPGINQGGVVFPSTPPVGIR